MARRWSTWRWAALVLVWCGAWGAAQAGVAPVTAITLAPSPGTAATEVLLPHFLRQEQSGLVAFDWRIRLPGAVHAARLPALLLPQPVQGATFWIGDELIYEIASSDEHSLRNWYRPVLVSIPKHLLSASQDTVIRVRQAGYLRGWFVSPMLAGDLADLRPWFDGYTLLSQTLSVTINMLSGLVGLFLLGIGWRTKGRAYTYSGLATLTWSLLFTLALISEMPTQQWFYWRLALYLLTGLLIYFISLFMFEIFRQRLHPRWQVAYFVYLNLGWLVFAVGGRPTEFALDFYWTGLAVGIYVGTTIWLIGKALQQRKLSALVPFFIHALVSSFFAFHDYILQAGWLPMALSKEVQPLWTYAVLQPIYLTHLALPSFVIMALWMLAQDHLLKTREALQHERQLQQQREQMVSDIHDGVGSRINMLLWDLRSSASSPDRMEMELQRCMDELRFAINPVEAGHETLHKALGDLCQRLQQAAEHVQITYTRLGVVRPVRSDQGIQLYKVVQECLSNALRHSQARQIDVELIQLTETVRVVVKDDGVGIPDWDERAQTQTARKLTSLGLQGLQQRMRSKGGDAYIQSGPEGTRVKCWLPLA
jgi:signal transduction histidine kinase